MPSPIERIAAAAIVCFRTSGINGTTMEDVARIAHVARPNIYRYAANLDDLVRLVVLERAHGIEAELSPKAGPWHEALADLFVQQVLRALDDEIFMIIVEQAAPLAARLLVDDPAVGSCLNGVLRPLIERGRAQNQLREDLSDDEILHWLHYQSWCLAREPRLVAAIDIEGFARKLVVGGLLAGDTASSGQGDHERGVFIRRAEARAAA